jgi:hypothetical protein
MAVGDTVIVNIGSSTNYYQPSSGVEIMVLKTFGDSQAFRFGLYNGTDTINTYHGTGTSRYDDSGLGNKYSITNTWYYRNDANTTQSGFSGIQIK